MSDSNQLLDHARRYFSQAGQSTDVKKMRLLVKLGLEFLNLANGDPLPTAPAKDAPPRKEGET
jgi:hypothetical protein